MMQFLLIIFAVSTLLGMSGYLGYLLYCLQRQKNHFAVVRKTRLKKVVDSIVIISQAMRNEQCDLSEGVIRLKPLLDVLGQKKLSHYSAMWELYQVVENMPILEARRTLQRNQRMKFDLIREKSEAELLDKIHIEVEQLLTDITLFKKEY